MWPKDAQAVLPPQGVIDVNGFVPDWANAEATTSRDSGDTGTQDFTAEGYELELTYNPSERWTTMVGVAEQETVLSNIYPRLQSYVNEHVLPNWVNSSFAKNYYIDDLGTETLADKATSTIKRESPLLSRGNCVSTSIPAIILVQRVT